MTLQEKFNRIHQIKREIEQLERQREGINRLILNDKDDVYDDLLTENFQKIKLFEQELDEITRSINI